MAKSAAKAKNTPKTVAAKTTTKPSIKPQNGKNSATSADAQKAEPTLPKSLINSLPTSARIMSDMASVSKLLPGLIKEFDNGPKRAGAVAMARSYVVLHRMSKRIEEILKPLDALVKQVKEVDVPEAFDAEKVPSVTLEEGFRVGVSIRTMAGIKAGQKEAAIEWLNANEKGDIVQETINASTLSALAREMAEENRELPDDIFNVALVPNTSVTKT